MRLCGTEGFSTSTSRKIEKIAEEEDPFVQRNSLEPVDEEKNIRLFICASLFVLCFPADAQQSKKLPRIGILDHQLH
jgi:hypothetical protein